MTDVRVDPVEWAADVSQRWFLDGQRDRLTLLDGTSGGWAFHVEAFDALVRFARGQIGTDPINRHPFAIAKHLGIDRALRAWALRVMAVRNDESRSGRVAVIAEVPTPSMLDPAILVAKALGRDARVASADPRVHRRLKRCGLRPTPLMIDLATQRRLLVAARAHVENRLDAILADPHPVSLGGHDVSKAVVRWLAPAAKRSLPWAVVEHASASRFLRDMRCTSLVLVSDQHRIGRVAVEAATELGIPTTVIQHGLPRIPIGLVPVVADRVAAWSDEAVDWFVRHGAPRPRLTVTGNARLDEVVNFDRSAARDRVAAETGLDREPRLLLALSPDAAEANRPVLAMAMEGTAVAQGTLIVKLHPGQGDWSWVEKDVRGHRAAERIRVLRADPLPPLLGWADVTVVHRSTVAVESLAHGTPVVVIEVAGRMSGAFAELRTLQLTSVADAAHLARLARELASEVGRQEYLAPRRQALERVVGPLDGRAAARIVQLALSAVTPSAKPPGPVS